MQKLHFTFDVTTCCPVVVAVSALVSYEKFSSGLLIYQINVTGRYKKFCIPKDYYAARRSQLAPSQCSL